MEVEVNCSSFRDYLISPALGTWKHLHPSLQGRPLSVCEYFFEWHEKQHKLFGNLGWKALDMRYNLGGYYAIPFVDV
jgi:hypothetical protein